MGTRLRETIGSSQKTMANVGDEPFLSKVLRYLKAQGFRRVILATGYRGDQVQEYYRKNNLGLTFEFAHEKEPLGTGGAVKNTEAFVRTSPFFVLNGDCFCLLSYKDFLQFHRTNKSSATLSVAKIKDSRDYGTILLGPRNSIAGFEEKKDKPGGGYVNVGAYCFNKEIFGMMPAAQSFSIERDFFPLLPVKLKERFSAFVIENEFLDIGTPDRYSKAGEMIRKAQDHGSQS